MLEKLIIAGFILIFVGVALIFLGSLMSALRTPSEGEAKVEGGGVIFIGPIPIVFGTSKQIAWYMLLAAIALAVLMFVLTLYVWRKIP